LTPATKPFVILLAEDEPADAYLVRMALAENRIEVELQHVTDGHEALAYLRRQAPRYDHAQRPDLILLDLHMPHMNGRECLAELKRDAALCDIPVVVLTTSQLERDVVGSYGLGAAEYLTKPLDLDQFIATIGRLGERWIPSACRSERP